MGQIEQLVQWLDNVREDKRVMVKLRNRARGLFEMIHWPTEYYEINADQKDIVDLICEMFIDTPNQVGVEFGSSLSDFSEVRMDKLLKSRSREVLIENLRGVRKLIHGSIDYVQLFWDIYYWEDDVRRNSVRERWVRYYDRP